MLAPKEPGTPGTVAIDDVEEGVTINEDGHAGCSDSVVGRSNDEVIDNFIIRTELPPWWKNRRLVCALIFVTVGIVAIAVGVSLSLNTQQESNNGGDTDDGASSSTPPLNPTPSSPTVPSVPNNASVPNTTPTSAPSLESTVEATSSVAISHLWRTIAPTGYVPRLPSPTTSPTVSLAPTPARPTLSPTISLTPTEECYMVDIAIVFDTFPTETSWSVHRVLTSGTTELIASHVEEDLSSMTHDHSICLPKGNYQFTIHDEFGDGMLDPGYYRLTSYGEVIGEGAGDFTHHETTDFSVPWIPVEVTHDTAQHGDFVLTLVEDVEDLAVNIFEEEVGV